MQGRGIVGPRGSYPQPGNALVRQGQQQPQQPEGPVTGFDVRRAMAGLEGKLQNQIDALGAKLREGSARVEDVLRSTSTIPGLGGVPQAQLGQLGEAIAAGRVMPYILDIDIPVDKGTQGQKLTGEVLATADGPLFISDMYAFAQVDGADAAAANFPFSLIPTPSCTADCGNDAFTADDADATFSLDFGTNLVAGVDMRGSFIPIDPDYCRLISYGSTQACATLSCPDGSTTNYTATVPLVMFDHADCLDGLVEMYVNTCGWQNVQFPIAMLSKNFSINNEVPECIGIGAYLESNKTLSASFTPTKKPLFDTIVSFVYAGFRMITCGPNGAIGT